MGSEIQNKQDQTTIAAIIINKQADQQPHSPVHFQQSTQEIEIKQSRSSSLNLQKFPPLKLKHNPLDNHKLVCCTTTQEHRSVYFFYTLQKKNQREGGTKGALSKKDRAALDGEEFHNSREHEGHEQKEANWRSKQNNSRSNSHAAAESLQPRRLRHAALGPRKPAQPPPAPLPLLVNCCGCSLAEGEKRSQKTQEHTAALLSAPPGVL